MTGVEIATIPFWVPIVTTVIQGGALVLSEYLGSRTTDNQNACRSIIGLIASTYNYFRKQPPDEPESIELAAATTSTATSAAWIQDRSASPKPVRLVAKTLPSSS